MRLRITSCRFEPAEGIPHALCGVVGEYAWWLPVLMKGHGVDPAAVPEVVLVFTGRAGAYTTQVHAVDDRGKHDAVDVHAPCL